MNGGIIVGFSKEKVFDTYPGQVFHMVVDGARCINHTHRKAIAHIQGATEANGTAQFSYVCAECLVEHQHTHKTLTPGHCDWCNKPAADTKYIRDYGEGLYGPEYCVCADCRRKHADAVHEEARREQLSYAYDG